MTQVTPIKDLRGYLSPEQVERVIGATTNPRDALEEERKAAEYGNQQSLI